MSHNEGNTPRASYPCHVCAGTMLPGVTYTFPREYDPTKPSCGKVVFNPTAAACAAGYDSFAQKIADCGMCKGTGWVDNRRYARGPRRKVADRRSGIVSKSTFVPRRIDVLEEAARVVEKIGHDYMHEHGSYDASTGAWEIHHRHAERIEALDDAVDAIRTLSGSPSAVTCLKHPQSHDEAMKRIGECVREIEMISDAFGYDPFEWLADDEETEKRSATTERSK